MRTPEVLHLDTDETITAIARLLREAAQQAWQRADREGPDSPWHGLGLGIFVVAAQATEFVPADVDPVEPVPPQHDVGQLVCAADDLALDLPIDGTLPGISELIVALTDLRRELTQ